MEGVIESGAGRTYHLVETVERGGFGTVYRGLAVGQGGFEKWVAIKVVHAGEGEAGASLARRLRDEARLLGHLRHPTIVQVEDLIAFQDRWAVVMEFVEGADLKRVIKEHGKMPLRVVAEIVRDVADALAAAHDARGPDGRSLHIVHRDVKPSNLRLTPRGAVKLIDFGIAQARFTTRESETQSATLGSPGYIAPERYDRKDGPAADVFGLGIVAWEMLRGARLGDLSVNPRGHDARIAEAMKEIAAPDDVIAMIRRMIAYETVERPTAQEVARFFRERVGTLPGPWLADWAPEVIGPLAEKAPTARPASLPPTQIRPEVPEQTLNPPDPPRTGDTSSTRVGLFVGVGLGAVVAGVSAAVLLAGVVGVALWMATPAGPEPDLPVLENAAPPREKPVEKPVGEPVVGAAAAPGVVPMAVPVPVAAPEPVAAPVVAPPRRAARAPTVEPAAPAGPPLGAVMIYGDAQRVDLVGDAGTFTVPGPVPAGRYTVRVWFGSAPRDLRVNVEVLEARTVGVSCWASLENCSAQ